MRLWRLTYANGVVEEIRASDLRAALTILPDGRPVLTKGHPDGVVAAAEVVDVVIEGSAVETPINQKETR